MCSISWNLDITFPQPFRTLEDLFSILELSLLRLMPMGCLAPFDFISDFYFITLTPLALLVVIVIVGVARAKLREHGRATVFNQHAFAALLLSFIVLPVASSKLFVRVFWVSRRLLALNRAPAAHADAVPDAAPRRHEVASRGSRR